MDIFTELKDYPGYWIAHSPARLLRERNGLLIECKQTPNSIKDTYWTVTLKNKEGKFVKQSMHRMLMETFVPNPLNKAHVNHIDGNKANNDLKNLEWATPKENAIHAHATGLSSSNWNVKAIHQYNLAGDYIASYQTDDDAQKATGIPKQNMSKVTLGKRIHAGYFQWSRELLTKLPPTFEKFIKGYILSNIFFNTLNELALYLGYSFKNGCGWNNLPKNIRNNITIVYYD